VRQRDAEVAVRERLSEDDYRDLAGQEWRLPPARQKQLEQRRHEQAEAAKRQGRSLTPWPRMVPNSEVPSPLPDTRLFLFEGTYELRFYLPSGAISQLTGSLEYVLAAYEQIVGADP
jgi:hypothetical protein